jgi:RimJ/RimL family protein N-acetyltransferase
LPKITLRRYEERDHAAVRQLFVDVNRELATPELRTAFEQYTARSLREEIDRIPQYYGERGGSFWVVELGDGTFVGMFGLEFAGGGAAELRRMYVAAPLRRRGVARAMLSKRSRYAAARDGTGSCSAPQNCSGPRSHSIEQPATNSFARRLRLRKPTKPSAADCSDTISKSG